MVFLHHCRGTAVALCLRVFGRYLRRKPGAAEAADDHLEPPAPGGKRRLRLIGICVLVAAIFGVGMLAARPASHPVRVEHYVPWSSFLVERAGAMAVQDGGRLKPVSTYAGFHLLRTLGKKEALPWRRRREKGNSLRWNGCWTACSARNSRNNTPFSWLTGGARLDARLPYHAGRPLRHGTDGIPPLVPLCGPEWGASLDGCPGQSHRSLSGNGLPAGTQGHRHGRRGSLRTADEGGRTAAGKTGAAQ